MRNAGMPMIGTNRMSSSHADDDDGRRFSGTTPTAMIFTMYSITIHVVVATDATMLRSMCSHFPFGRRLTTRCYRTRISPAEAALHVRTDVRRRLGGRSEERRVGKEGRRGCARRR